MAKLIEITGKAISGEWGQDDKDNSGIPVLRTTNFTNNGSINFDNVVTRKIKGRNVEKKILRAGDIIVEKSGGSDKQPVGRVVLFEGTEKRYLFNNFTGLLRVKDTKKWLSKYVFYSMFSNYKKGGTRKYENRTTGLHNLKLDDYISKFEVSEAEILKQKTICDCLDEISKIAKNKKRQIVDLDQLVQARFVEMFGDPVLNPKGWPVHQLSAYIKFLTSGSRGWAQYFSDDGEYFITIKNVKNCHVSLDNMQYITPPDNAEAKRTKVQENDLLISITADLGRTGVITKKIAEHGAYINQHLTCIRLDKQELNTLYVAYYMESDAGKEQFQSKNQSAVKAGLNFNSINSLRLIVPPLSLQNQFADFVAQIDKSKLREEKRQNILLGK